MPCLDCFPLIIASQTKKKLQKLSQTLLYIMIMVPSRLLDCYIGLENGTLDPRREQQRACFFFQPTFIWLFAFNAHPLGSSVTPPSSRFPSSHKMHSLQSGCRSGDEERMTSKNPSVQPGNLQRLLMGFVRYGQWCSWRVQIILGFMAGGGEVVVSSSCATPRCTHACCLPVQRHSMGWGNCGHPS